jgi:hypothetical protein
VQIRAQNQLLEAIASRQSWQLSPSNGARRHASSRHNETDSLDQHIDKRRRSALLVALAQAPHHRQPQQPKWHPALQFHMPFKRYNEASLTLRIKCLPKADKNVISLWI